LAADKEELEEKKQEVENKKQEIEEKKEALESQKEELVDLEAELDDQIAEKEKLMDKLEEEHKHLENHKISLEDEQEILDAQKEAVKEAKQLAEDEKNALEEQAVKEKAERKKEEQSAKQKDEPKKEEQSEKQSTGTSGSSKSNSGTPKTTSTAPAPSGGGKFSYPTSGGITSGYGQRWGTLHAGVDFGVGVGTPVTAAASGVVISTNTTNDGQMNGYGNVILVAHSIGGSSYTTLYAHLSSMSVSAGDKVSRGQTIGASGNTGDSTGPHLHFEIHKGGWNASKSNSVDPLSSGYLN